MDATIGAGVGILLVSLMIRRALVTRAENRIVANTLNHRFLLYRIGCGINHLLHLRSALIFLGAPEKYVMDYGGNSCMDEEHFKQARRIAKEAGLRYFIAKKIPDCLHDKRSVPPLPEDLRLAFLPPYQLPDGTWEWPMSPIRPEDLERMRSTCECVTYTIYDCRRHDHCTLLFPAALVIHVPKFEAWAVRQLILSLEREREQRDNYWAGVFY